MMFHDCPQCYATGYVFVDGLFHDTDLHIALCPVCDGEGVIDDTDDTDDTDEEGQEGNDNAE